MRELAPGKVNLCLFLGPLRDDGRHELLTVIESVSLADELEMSESDADEVVCPGVEGPNLVSAALEGLRAHGWAGPPVRVEVPHLTIEALLRRAGLATKPHSLSAFCDDGA